jgi:hypothetical protein
LGVADRRVGEMRVIGDEEPSRRGRTDRLPARIGCAGSIIPSHPLGFLADNMTETELLGQYPGLTHEDVLAAIAYGAEIPRERIIPVPTENAARK